MAGCKTDFLYTLPAVYGWNIVIVSQEKKINKTLYITFFNHPVMEGENQNSSGSWTPLSLMSVVIQVRSLN